MKTTTYYRFYPIEINKSGDVFKAEIVGTGFVLFHADFSTAVQNAKSKIDEIHIRNPMP